MAECLSTYLCNQLILNDITETCENPMYSGMDERALIFNFTELKKRPEDVDSDNPRIIKNFTFISGAKPFFIVNARTNPYTGTNTAVEVGDFRNTFTRTVSLFVPMDGANASAMVLDPLAHGRFVVVLRNSFVNTEADNEYQVYGYDRGLVVSSMTQTKYENNDYWVVELQETGVPNSGKFLIHNEESPATDANLLTCTLVNENSTGVYKLQYTDADSNLHVVASFDFAAEPYNGIIGESFSTMSVPFTYEGANYLMDASMTALGDGSDGTISNMRLVTDTSDYFCSLVAEEENA